MAAIMFGSITVDTSNVFGNGHLRVYGGNTTRTCRVESCAQSTQSTTIGDSCAITHTSTLGTPVPKELMAKSEFAIQQERLSLARRRCLRFNNDLPTVRAKLAQEKERELAIFVQLEKRLNLTEARQDKFLLKDKKGRVYWKVPSKRQLRKIQKSKRRIRTFQAPDNVISNIKVDFDDAGEICCEAAHVKTATSRSTKRAVSYKVLKGESIINHLIREISKICKAENKVLEICTERKRRVIHFKDHQAFVRLRHMEGIVKQRDCETNPELEALFERICETAVGRWNTPSSKIVPGSSGLVVFKGRHLGKYSSSPGNYFIVRGRHEDKLYDARIRIGYIARHKMVHY
nr:P1 protein [Moroccan watermelon mosaic virus]